MSASLFLGTMVFGALGAVCRAFLMDKVRPHLPIGFPWPTLIVNIFACFLIGLVVSHGFMPELQTMLCTGFMGGFSTMSTLNHDAMTLVRNRHYVRFFAYLIGTYAVCLIACALGLCL